MYKLIIVDDEEIIRRGLTNMMEWDNIGFELAATFEDGREAIAYLQENSVDVVLTDIRMRDISGLEVAQYVHEHLPHVKVVIISGYREFDYAKQAVEYNVVHYLVKPTQFDEVENIFKQIKAELDKEKTLEQESTKLKQRYEELMPLLQEQFFVDLLMGALIDEEEIQRRMRLLDMSGTPQNTSCILIHFNVYNYDKFLNENWEYGKERLDNAIRNFFNVKEEGIIYYTLPNNEGDIKAIALSTSYEDLNQMNVSVSRQLEKINRLIKSLMNLELEVKTGESFSNMISLANYKTSNRFRHITTDNDDKLVLEPVEYKQLISKYKLFMSIIYEGDKKAVNSLVETFLSEMEDLPLNVIKHIMIDMFAVLTKEFMELGTDIWEITREKVSYEQILDMKDAESIGVWCKNIFMEMIEHKNKNHIAYGNVIQKALDYIHLNFHKDISLDDIADQVFLNPVYFSRLFKQQVGETFTDYLTQIRMEQAMLLLKKKTYKIYEISEKVGYQNSKYFTRVFKQYTGCTTTEYLKMVSDLESDTHG